MPFIDESFTVPQPEYEPPPSLTPDTHLITVGYAHYGTVADEFCDSLMLMREYDREHGQHWDAIAKSRGPYIPLCRNEIVRQFLEDRFSHWLLFLDNDVIFPPYTMERLLSLANPEEVPILGGLYLTPLQPDPENLARMDYLPTWTHTVEHERTPVLSVDFDEPLIQLDTCGMGCTLIHRSVFEAMWDAFPDDPWKWYNHDLIENGSQSSSQFARLGEDYSFCMRAKKLGFKVWGTPRVACGHIKSQVLYPLSYRYARSPNTLMLPATAVSRSKQD